MTRILCVNGWAQPVDGLSVVAPGATHLDYGDCHDFGATDRLIAATLPEADLVIGWSLGASILRHAFATGSLNASRALFLAPPIQFLATSERPGMDRLTFDLFRQSYSSDPVRTARRFAGLIAKGDRDEARLLREHPGSPTAADRERWIPWLGQLTECSFGDWRFSIAVEILIIQGENDGIVSTKNAEALAREQPSIILDRYSECGHAPHWHAPDAVRARIAELTA